jgi:hypothetical protein
VTPPDWYGRKTKLPPWSESDARQLLEEGSMTGPDIPDPPPMSRTDWIVIGLSLLCVGGVAALVFVFGDG